MFESKINRGRANGYAPLDSGSKVPLEYLPPIQSTIDTGSLATTASLQTLINRTGSYATTGSNSFFGNQNISGSVIISSSLTVSSTFVNNANLQLTGSNLIIDSGSLYVSGSINVSGSVNVSSTFVNRGTIDLFQSDLIIDSGSIILSGSFVQQVNYAPFGSASYSGATILDITKGIHLLDVTGIATDNHWILPDGLYDGQVVKFVLKGDGTANPNGIYIWPNHLRSGLGLLRNGQSWSPFYDNNAGSARSLATAVYVDGAWNIDNSFYNLD